MKCPVDDSDLSISSREGIEIDFCPQCRGVWLDRGELDKIIERAAVSVVGATPEPAARSREPAPRDDRYDRDRGDDRRDERRYDDPRYDDKRHDSRDPRKKKKRSFLEDLFEFD